jgi:hypothetical protein
MMADSNTVYISGILLNYESLTTKKFIRPDLPLPIRTTLHLYAMLLEKRPCAQGYHKFTEYSINYILAEELLKFK